MLEVVAQKTGLKTINIRVGQLSGTGTNGFWSTTDWVPIIVASSLGLGVLPDAVGVSRIYSPNRLGSDY